MSVGGRSIVLYAGPNPGDLHSSSHHPTLTQSVSTSCLFHLQHVGSNHSNRLHQLQLGATSIVAYLDYSKTLLTGHAASTPAPFFPVKQPERSCHFLPRWPPNLFRIKAKFLHTQPLSSYAPSASSYTDLSLPCACGAHPTPQGLCWVSSSGDSSHR
ncbi:hypothetical protein HJG60_012099 [Phyllostomus discolor]|uniref:Uncharacterized protein n=1 Tax=Phyllostomus discolor TaxID=89673 RepID=A0A833ZMA9_9CHIR|nr:hypothetical protein HJG60_012099 [Phyllostomus discolor]